MQHIVCTLQITKHIHGNKKSLCRYIRALYLLTSPCLSILYIHHILSISDRGAKKNLHFCSVKIVHHIVHWYLYHPKLRDHICPPCHFALLEPPPQQTSGQCGRRADATNRNLESVTKSDANFSPETTASSNLAWKFWLETATFNTPNMVKC